MNDLYYMRLIFLAKIPSIEKISLGEKFKGVVSPKFRLQGGFLAYPWPSLIIIFKMSLISMNYLRVIQWITIQLNDIFKA